MLYYVVDEKTFQAADVRTAKLDGPFNGKLAAYEHIEKIVSSCRGSGWVVGFIYRLDDDPITRVVVDKNGNKLSYSRKEFERLKRRAEMFN